MTADQVANDTANQSGRVEDESEVILQYTLDELRRKMDDVGRQIAAEQERQRILSSPMWLEREQQFKAVQRENLALRQKIAALEDQQRQLLARLGTLGPAQGDTEANGEAATMTAMTTRLQK